MTPADGTARSADGSLIRYQRAGAGPPLVLMHGGMLDATCWAALSPQLEPRFTVYAVDRRGRGGSGDAGAQTVQQEVEDLSAVLREVGGRPLVFGHSSGALVVLHAARRRLRLSGAVLYEPPVLTAARHRVPDLADRLDRLLAAGDREATVETFARYGPGMDDAAVDALRGTSRWRAALDLAHTLPSDARLSELVVEPERLAGLDVPVSLLLGEQSPGWMQQGVRAVAAALPRAEVAMLAGQGHRAIFTAPQLVSAQIQRMAVNAQTRGLADATR
jgi:pimeloyl-ACP methyl ester carboxylesterase